MSIPRQNYHWEHRVRTVNPAPPEGLYSFACCNFLSGLIQAAYRSRVTFIYIYICIGKRNLAILYQDSYALEYSHSLCMCV